MFNRAVGSVIGATIRVTIDTNAVDWNLIDEAFDGTAPTAPVKVAITVNSGIQVTASSTATPAMDLTGLPAGSSIKLINNGYILGQGGQGGKGRSMFGYYEPGGGGGGELP